MSYTAEEIEKSTRELISYYDENKNSIPYNNRGLLNQIAGLVRAPSQAASAPEIIRLHRLYVQAEFQRTYQELNGAPCPPELYNRLINTEAGAAQEQLPSAPRPMHPTGAGVGLEIGTSTSSEFRSYGTQGPASGTIPRAGTGEADDALATPLLPGSEIDSGDVHIHVAPVAAPRGSNTSLSFGRRQSEGETTGLIIRR